MSGEEFILQCRINYQDSKAKIVIVSGNDQIKQISEKVGAHAYLEKPVDLKKLQTQVQDLVK
ncbi:MAG: hypothetical protein H7326_11260 [Bdellovibrionaceae bacterium]|nr:hypothetical protein [Pseudobdellovibrionaceae bacterium]